MSSYPSVSPIHWGRFTIQLLADHLTTKNCFKNYQLGFFSEKQKITNNGKNLHLNQVKKLEIDFSLKKTFVIQ